MHPDAKQHLEKIAEEAEDVKNFSPRFTSTKDALDWLNA